MDIDQFEKAVDQLNSEININSDSCGIPKDIKKELNLPEDMRG